MADDYTDDEPKPLNAQSLRNVASWLDTYDGLAALLYDIIEKNPEVLNRAIAPEALAACREASSGDAIQRDLRRWADELDRREARAADLRQYLEADPRITILTTPPHGDLVDLTTDPEGAAMLQMVTLADAVNTDDNPHAPWPIEPLCCSYHYPVQ
jgi:hypothetical protein